MLGARRVTEVIRRLIENSGSGRPKELHVRIAHSIDIVLGQTPRLLRIASDFVRSNRHGNEEQSEQGGGCSGKGSVELVPRIEAVRLKHLRSVSTKRSRSKRIERTTGSYRE